MNEPARILTCLAPLTLAGLAAADPAAAVNALGRDRDPVVLTGASLPALLGAAPGRIVAFRYAGGWVQIPVQVDERAVVDFATIYNYPTPSGLMLLTYTDPDTWTGPDPVPAFDADDELVLMARDAGDLRAGAPEPPGTLPGTGVELEVTNPLNGARGYVYLFQSDGGLDPGPGPDPVAYDFYLLPSGNSYKSQYQTMSGPNPENSTVTTAHYAVHFSDRWICDEVRVFAGGATGVDILDRRKNLFAPGNCQRSEQTFSNGEGAFIVSRQGPVRALRGYVGANSGPTTYRIHRFYEAREEVFTALRVHAIPGVMDFFDYSPAASGMTYRNDLNPVGLAIDGVPDAAVLGPLQWEMVTGPQGTLVMTGLIETDIPGLSTTSYYQDLAPAPAQCTGDNAEYGASGLRIANPIPNTDPAVGAYYTFESVRVIAYDGPGKDLAFAQARAAEARTPLTATAMPYLPVVAVGQAAAPSFSVRVGPLPASRVARIALALPRAGELQLEVLDLSGRLVERLAAGPWSAGTFTFAWNAGDRPAGVYFLQAQLAGAGRRLAPIVLVR